MEKSFGFPVFCYLNCLICFFLLVGWFVNWLVGLLVGLFVCLFVCWLPFLVSRLICL